MERDARLARLDLDLESMDRAQWWDMLTLLVSLTPCCVDDDDDDDTHGYMYVKKIT